ncbi:MAG: hypothetical protein GX359_01580 [Clostridiales bacterium]|nr:hypothetical protein [Clostridiales bacterium]
MICNTCGRQTQNEGANFCEYCGSSFRENRVMPDFVVSQNDEAGQHAEQQGGHSIAQETEKPVTFVQWLGVYALLFIPLFIPMVGWIIPLVLLFVWAFANNTPTTKKNWSRATLIFLLVYFIITVITVIRIMNTPIFQQFMRGTLGLSL